MSESLASSSALSNTEDQAMSTSLACVTFGLALLGQMPPEPSTGKAKPAAKAAEPAKSEPAAKAEQDELLRLLKEKATELDVYRGSEAKEPRPLIAEPILRYSNAETTFGSLQGATFLWLEGGRPLTAVSFWLRRADNAVIRECTSFSSAPLECRVGGRAVWSPKTGGLLEQRLPDAPAPAEKKAQRLTQMRNLARRFTATCYQSRTGQPTNLRLLPQPLYRFADEKAGVLDGALFAFVVSNDPELFLMLEAARDGKRDEAQWRFSLARMSSHKGTVRLDDKEIWSVPNFYQDKTEDRKTGPYTEGKVGTFTPSAPAPGS
jgi:hypothetical protein